METYEEKGIRIVVNYRMVEPESIIEAIDVLVKTLERINSKSYESTKL